ncbi:pentatricopeptide repeat-containing protein At3g18020 [Magnolia sinica]|uniref:pentatricopeptide repeat-containing protein At3g18020 n=1 Tax=Magnolia sinica TaxID=86752 RepID=UPI00265ACFA3|nr:pentatricopeptide repeat-containing protein At3g18020 [Magnolia sinica]
MCLESPRIPKSNQNMASILLPRPLIRKPALLRFINTLEFLSPEIGPLDDEDQADEEKISISNRTYWTRKIHTLCTTQSDVDAAIHLLDRLRLRGYVPTPFNLSSIVHALCGSDRFSEAHRRLLLSLASPSFSLDHRTCNVLLARLLDARTPSLTLRVVNRMIAVDGSFVPSIINYNRLIDQLCSDSKLLEARQLFDDMLSRGHSPNAVSYTSLINGFCKIGELGVAQQLFDEMLKRGIPPNSLTYSILLKGVLRKRKVEEGKELMQKLWQWMLDEEGPSSVNNASFANLVDALCREGFYHEVFKIAEEMPQGKSVCEEFAYGQMIDSLCRARRNHGASRIVYIMRKRGFVPSLVSYNSIVHGLSKEGGCMRAYQLFKEGIEFGYLLTEPTYKVLVESLCRESDLCKAKDVLDFMLDRVADKTRIYNIYLNALCVLDNTSELLNALVSMLQNQCKPDVVTLNTVIHGFCKMGRVDDAMKVLDDMLAGNFCGPDVVTFTTIIGGLLNVGLMDAALDLLHRKMPESGCRPSVVTYNVVLRGLCKFQKIDVAMEIFSGMVREGVSADSTTYTIILDGFFGSNRIEEAKKFWDGVIWPSKIHDDFVYAAILRGLCDAGRMNEACDFLYELVDCGVAPKIVNYNIVIDSACNLGLKQEAYRLVREMRKNGLVPDAVTWRTLDKLHGNAQKRCVSVRNEETQGDVEESSMTGDVEDEESGNSLKERMGEDSLEGLVDPSFITEEQRKEEDSGDGDNHGDDFTRDKEIWQQSGRAEPLSRMARRVFGLL